MNFKTEEERAAYDAKITNIQKLVVNHCGWRTCLNCINWSTKHKIVNAQTIDDKHCILYKATPPPEVIVHGCRDWDDDIPF